MSALRVILNAAALCVLAAPLAIAAAALSGHGHRWPDILAQFTAPALLAAVGFTVLLAVMRLKWPVLAGVVVCGLLLLAVWPQWFPAKETPRPGAPVVTLYSANLWTENTDVAAIKASITAANPDILVLIELGGPISGHMDEILAGYPHRVITPPRPREDGAERTVVASKYPVSEVPHRPAELSNVAALVQTPLGPINVVGVHLTRPWPYDYQWGQIIQATALSGLVAELQGPVIVAGDFNSVSSARIGRQVQAETGLVPAPGWPGTWPSSLPSAFGFTIDQVYHSPSLALVDRKLAKPMGSDHRAVVTRFTQAQMDHE